jgi:hypothetical protein
MVKRTPLTKAKGFAAAALCGLLAASPWAWAEEAHHPAADEATAVTTPSGSPGMPMRGSAMMGQGTSGAQAGASEERTGAAPAQTGPQTGQAGGAMGMPMGGPGMMGGMMPQAKMAKGMMGPRMGGGPMGCGMQQGYYSRLLGRIDVLEARIAALQGMVERLLER